MLNFIDFFALVSIPIQQMSILYQRTIMELLELQGEQKKTQNKEF